MYMKKFFYLLLALPLFASLAACDDDGKNIPDVNISLEYSGATLNDGALYVVKGETLAIEGINVTPAPGTGKATLGQTTYLWDGVPFYTTAISPFGVNIETEDMSEGPHTLTVNAQIFQIDKSTGWGVFQYKVVIVPDTDNQPDDEGGGTDVPETTIAESVD